jgi:hypothetical protein
MTLATTKLDAVNQMLSSIGEAPAVSIDTDNSEIAVAESTLDEVSRAVQAEGWNFNTEYEYPFPQAFKDYITTRAARVFAGKVVASSEQIKIIAQDELSYRANALAYDTKTSEVNIFGMKNGQNTYISYTPFNTIAR